MYVQDEKCMKNFIQDSEGAIWNKSIKIMNYYSECGYELTSCGPVAVCCEHGNGLINSKEFLD
jgi:hypothetical protein